MSPWNVGWFAVYGVAWAATRVVDRFARARILSGVVAQPGIPVERPAFFSKQVVAWQSNGISFEATMEETFEDGGNPPLLEVRVQGLGSALSLHPRTPKETPARSTGDPRFDRLFTVQAERPDALGLLDGESRDALRALAASNVEVRLARGMLRARIPGTKEGKQKQMNAVLRSRFQHALPLIELVAHALTPRPAERPGELLLERVRKDPLVAVRLAALETLLATSGGAARAEALRTAAADPDPALRFYAAREAGREGIPVLLEVAKSRTVPAALQAQALIALEPLIAREELAELSLAALRAPRSRVRATAAALAGRLGVRAAVPLLAAAAEHADVPEQRAVAEALGRIGSADAEAPLISLLGSGDVSVQRASVEWLARVGGPASVAPLHALASRASGELAREAEAAVARIQSRLDGAGAGQLELAESEAGRLSIPPDGGAVSLAPAGKPPKRALE